MIIIYVDIVLLTILFVLTVFTCVYCLVRVHRMRRTGQIEVFLRPTRVLFSRRKDDHSDELRTIVAYKNPITGEYCVHKSRAESRVYCNRREVAPGTDSDSGLSPEGDYEAMSLTDAGEARSRTDREGVRGGAGLQSVRVCDVNVIEKTRNWNYTEYQI